MKIIIFFFITLNFYLFCSNDDQNKKYFYDKLLTFNISSEQVDKCISLLERLIKQYEEYKYDLSIKTYQKYV